MNSLIWFLLILSMVAIVKAAPNLNRRDPGPSWFDLQPHMRQSKSQTGRAQQKRHARKRR